MKKFCVVVLIIGCITSPALALDEDSPRMTPVVKIVAQVSPSVVNISSERTQLLKGHAVRGRKAAHSHVPSLGSGVVFDEEGLILTNAHVIHNTRNLYITFSDGTRVEGRVIALNHAFDLAAIKIDPPFPLKTIQLAEPDDLMIGEPVVAVGNPFGLSSTVTTGVVSAIHRDLYSPQGKLVFKDLIQTDAAINPGSSGGALLNMDGKLIGLSQVVALQAEGIGFAIPVKTLKSLLLEFRELHEKHKPIRIPVQ